MLEPHQPWTIRAVQLDLARQRETLPAIFEFTRFAADWGYNTLLLYLEGVVRTPSFPHRPADRSYTLDDMRQIVAFAQQQGIEVVPCVSTLGHAEHFVDCPELAHLAEQVPDHFGGHQFCPSHEGTYEFLARYLAEIASVFPSQHFHVGCDEAWGLGSCPQCSQRKSATSYSRLLIDHIERVRAILTPLGKRAWIWDDLIEYVPEAELTRLSRDVVMCFWQYGAEAIDLDGSESHFGALQRRDVLTLYERLGFDALVCPVAGNPLNTRVITRYGRQHKLLGGLQTIWELGSSFLPAQLPGAAFAGWLWSHPQQSDAQALEETLTRLLPTFSPTQRRAVALAMSERNLSGSVGPGAASLGPLTVNEAHALAAAQLAALLLAPDQLPANASLLEQQIAEHLRLPLQAQIAHGRLREIAMDLIDPRVASYPDSHHALLEELEHELRAIADQRLQQWRQLRPGLEPERASGPWRNGAQQLAAWRSELAQQDRHTRGLLDFDLFLWDGFSAPQMKIELCTEGQWQTLREGMIKPVDLRRGSFRGCVPFAWNGKTPTRLRISVHGFGGQGVSFASLHTADVSFVPAKIERTSGRVIDPDNLLIDDSRVCFLGWSDTISTLMARDHATVSSVEVSLVRSAAVRHQAG